MVGQTQRPWVRQNPRKKSFRQLCLRAKIVSNSIVPVARFNHPLLRLSIDCSRIVNTNHPIKIKRFLMLCTKKLYKLLVIFVY